MKPNIIIASRLKQLREGMGLSQGEFAEKFSDFSARNTTYSVMTISNWETGRKLPPSDTLVWYADFFGVTTDYILGRTDELPEDVNAPQESKGINDLKKKITIKFNELAKYDHQPVFISDKNGKFKAQWGILSYAKRQIITEEYKLNLSPELTYSITTPPEAINVQSLAHHFVSYEELIKMDMVYIESLSPDPVLRGQVSGWYHHTPDKKCLINEKGLMLSYEGLNVTYRALDTKKTSKKK